ncbi:MAG: DMT family transporter [Thermoplasmata archaeon]|nr:DMT family transporter [Thermoplasmata archaeon]
MEVEELKIQKHKKKIRIGILMGVFCALFWGIWYVPGYAVWDMSILSELYTNVKADFPEMDDATVGLIQAVFLTGINAIACAVVLFIWNGCLGKTGELKRTVVQFKSASKYFLMAGICGACAVSGTYIATNFISSGFAAIAGLLYPIIGTALTVLVLKQKVSRRAYLGITVILLGGVTLYLGTIAANGLEGSYIGLIGGIMAAVGWGCEGAVAGKALDLCEPDVGLHLRFIFEALFWCIVMGCLAVAGVPIFSTVGWLLDPATLFVVVLLGLSFGWCYVTWYKSFPFLGVPRGQAIGSLYAACAVIFLIIFFGPEFALGYTEDTMVMIVGSTIAGLIICLIGSYLLASEDTESLVSLRDDKPSTEGGESA